MGRAYNPDDPAAVEKFRARMRNKYRMKAGIPLDAPLQRAGRKAGSMNKKVEAEFDAAITAMGPLKYYWQ